MKVIEHVRQGLDLVRSIIDSSLLSDEEEKDIRKAYDEIAERINLPFLNLSVIGEFSAGKSTLINEILGIDLLKTDILACTAVPTYIYCSEKPVLDMTVETVDGEIFLLHSLPEKPLLLEEESACKLFEYLKASCGYTVAPDFSFNTQDTIALLTSEGQITRYLSRVIVTVPDYTLGEKTRLIDTPGIDATGEEGQRHEEVTRKVLQSEADGLMLVLNPEYIYSSTLERFLSDNADGFMEHSFIVINKADLIPDDQREEIFDYVHDIIKSRFSVDVPVYMVSATGASDGGVWEEKFKLMMSGLMEHLENSHEAIMDKMLLNCMDKIMESSRKTLISRSKEMESQKSLFESNKPEKLENILTVLRARMEQTIEDKCYSKELSYRWYTAAANCKKSVAADLQELKTVKEIRSYAMGQRMEGRISEVFSSLESELSREMEGINRIFKELYDAAIKEMQDSCQAILTSSPLHGSVEASDVSLRTNSDELLRRVYAKATLIQRPLIPSLARLEEARSAVIDGLSMSLAEQERFILSDATGCLVDFANERKNICLDTFRESVPQYRELYENVARQYRLLWKKYEGEISQLGDFLVSTEEWEKQGTETV